MPDFLVTPEFHGQRLDRFLVGVMADHSRSQIQKLIAEGQVHVAAAEGTSSRSKRMRQVSGRRLFATQQRYAFRQPWRNASGDELHGHRLSGAPDTLDDHESKVLGGPLAGDATGLMRVL